MLLFRPLIKLRIVGSTVSPRETCLQAAETIQNLLSSYAKLYTLKRTPTLTFYLALTTYITGLVMAGFTAAMDRSSPSGSFEPRISQILTRGVTDLERTASCRECASRTVKIVRSVVRIGAIGFQTPGADCMGSDECSQVSVAHTGYMNAATELLRHCFIFDCAADGGSLYKRLPVSDVIKENGNTPLGPFGLRNRHMRSVYDDEPESLGFELL